MKRDFIIKRDLGSKEGEGKNGKYYLHDLEIEWTEILLNGDSVTQSLRVTASGKLKEDVLRQHIANRTAIPCTLWFSTSIYNGNTYNNIKIWLPRELRQEA